MLFLYVKKRKYRNTYFFFLFWILFSQNISARVSENAQKWFSRGLSLALKGNFIDFDIIEKIESIYKKSSEKDEKVIAAYLLTYAPRSLLSKTKEDLLKFVLSSKEKDFLLNYDSIARVVRLYADFLYEKGNFKEAIHYYEKLLKSSELRDYALLKIGWSYLNLKEPQKAYFLWIEEVSRKQSTGILPRAFYHGIGQSLAENTNINEKDVENLKKISLNDDTKKALLNGIKNGISTLKSRDDILKLIKVTRLFPWHLELLALIFEDDLINPKEACELVSLLEPNVFPYQPFGRKIEHCINWLLDSNTDKGKYGEVLSKLEEILPLFSLYGTERSFRFRFYDFSKNYDMACKDGMEWLFEETKERNHIPATLIALNCLRSKKVCDNLANFITKIHNNSFSYLKSSKDPLTYFLTRVANLTCFQDSFYKELVKNISLYTETLVPMIFMETLLKKRKFDKAYELATFFLDSSALYNKKLFEKITYSHINNLIEEHSFDEAYKLLNKHFPVTSQHSILLWTLLLDKSKDKARNWQKASLSRLLIPETFKRFRYLVPKFFELAIFYEDWISIWNNFNNVTRELSPKFRDIVIIKLFTALVENKFIPPQNTATSELEFLKRLSLVVKSGDENMLLSLVPVGNDIIVKDFLFIQKFCKQKNLVFASLKNNNDSISKIRLWLKFAKVIGKKISSREWSSPLLFFMTKNILTNFFKNFYEIVTLRGKDSNLSEKKWLNLIQILKEKMNEYLNTLTLARDKK